MSVDRCRHYLHAIGPAIEGSGGDHTTYQAARACYGFGLSQEEAMRVMVEWNASCSPPWREQELQSKIKSVYRRTDLPHGYMLENNSATWTPPKPRDIVYPPGIADYLRECASMADKSPVLRWAESRGVTEIERSSVLLSFYPRAPSTDFWWPDDYEVICPLFDAHGVPRSCKARWSKVDEDPIMGVTKVACAGAKSLPPSPRGRDGGFDIAKLVLANLRGIIMLSTGQTGAYDGGQFYPSEEPRRVWIVEGEPDLLALSVMLERNEARRDDPVLGVYPGAWTAEHAARIPCQSTVVIATHADSQGRKFADEVYESVYGRVAHITFHGPSRRH